LIVAPHLIYAVEHHKQDDDARDTNCKPSIFPRVKEAHNEKSDQEEDETGKESEVNILGHKWDATYDQLRKA
jgi:hypothetical protein